MNRRIIISLFVLSMFALSSCSDQARYNRYVRASVRAKEKRQKQFRKEMAKQNREQMEALENAEPLPPSVTIH